MNAEETKQLLTRCWMTHDAMWFRAAWRDLGMDRANQLNKAAIHGLAPIEVKRLQKALGLKQIADLEDLHAFMVSASELFIGDYMDFDWELRQDGRLHIEIGRCFAHEGMKRLGVVDQYRCGIFERLHAWFEALGLEHHVDPPIEGCLKHETGGCARIIVFENLEPIRPPRVESRPPEVP
jgi:hypothetical protein